MYLFVDTETIGADLDDDERDELLEASVPKNYKKPESREKWKAENAAEITQKTALDSMRGRLWMIGWAIDDGPVSVIRDDGPDEEAILREFSRVVPDRATWVCHNGLRFDLPWLWRRAIKYGMYDLADRIPHDQWAKGVDDTSRLWAATDYRTYHSLDKIARYLGCTPKLEGVHGSESGRYHREGRGEEFARYAAQDVETLREVHRRILGVR